MVSIRGTSLDSSFPMCQESPVLVIQRRPFSPGCFFIILKYLLTFSCKTRGFCPSCHAKRLEEWAERVGKAMIRPGLSLEKLSFKVVAFITDYQAVDRIIDHLKLTLAAKKPPAGQVYTQVAPEGGRGASGVFLRAFDFGGARGAIVF